jgi:uncharacterized membrane protein YeaQ/YmgE (transglycosylase-associated protein family)
MGGICGVVGAMIGQRKGFPVWGFFMGAILGVIGLVILAFVRPDHKALVRRERERQAIAQEAQADLAQHPGTEWPHQR